LSGWVNERENPIWITKWPMPSQSVLAWINSWDL
jgi:hypothetical protein